MNEAEAKDHAALVAYAETQLDQQWSGLRGNEEALLRIGLSDEPIRPEDQDLIQRACLLVSAELDTRGIKHDLEIYNMNKENRE